MPVPRMMRVGPFEDSFDLKRGERLNVSFASMFGQQACKRGAA
jgi:hypothetical protein